MMNFASVLQGFGSALGGGDEEQRRREEEERRRREEEQQRLAALQQQQQQLRARIDNQAPMDYSLPGAAAPVSPQDLAAQQQLEQQRLIASTATDTGEVPGVTTQPPAQPGPAQPAQGLQIQPQQAAAFMPTPAVANTRPTSLTTRFVTAADSGDRDELMRISTDTAAPEWLRRQSADEAYRIMDRERQTRTAEKQVANAVSQGDLSPIQRELRRSGEEGSVFRAVLYRALKLTDLAAEEQRKLGAGTRWSTVRDDQGRPALIQTRADGKPIAGYDEQGNTLGETDLIRFAGQAGITAGQATGTRIRDEAGVEWSQVPTQRGMIFYNNQGQRGTPKGRTVPISVGGDVQLQRELMMQRFRGSLENLKAEERIKSVEEANRVLIAEGQPPMTLSQIGLDSRGNFVTRGAVTQTPATAIGGGAATATPQPAAAPAAPAARPQPQPAAPAAAPAAAVTTPTGAPAQTPLSAAQVSRRGAGEGDIVKEAAKIVSQAPDLEAQAASIERAIEKIDSGRHNIGPLLSTREGRGPVAQAIGRQFETEDARNTISIMDTVNKLAADGLKTLGSNPSTVDLQFWTRFKPNETSDPVFVKTWINEARQRMVERLNQARDLVSSGGRAATAPRAPAPSAPAAPLGSAANPIRLD